MQACRHLSSSTRGNNDSLYTTEAVVGWLRAERAEAVRALSVSGLLGGAVGECLIFATGRSAAHVTRIANAIQQEFKDAGVVRFGQAPSIEGSPSDDWLLIDGGSVVVSVMVPAARDLLRLEEHWQAQGATEIELPADKLAEAANEMATGDVPKPPVHWNVHSPAASVGQDVYREEGDVIFEEEEEEVNGERLGFEGKGDCVNGYDDEYTVNDSCGSYDEYDDEYGMADDSYGSYDEYDDEYMVDYSYSNCDEHQYDDASDSLYSEAEVYDDEHDEHVDDTNRKQGAPSSKTLPSAA